MDTRKAVKTYHRNLAIVLAIIVAIFAAIPLVVDKPYIINIFVLTFYMSTLSMAWNILGGITGQNSLGLAAYMGLGAYVCCLVVTKTGMNPWVAAVLDMLVVGVVAGVIFFPSLILRGPYFTLVSIAFAESIRQFIINSEFFGRASGVGLPFGKDSFAQFRFTSKVPYYYIGFIMMVGVYLIMKKIGRSKLGFALRTIREDEDAAAAIGINPTKYKVIAVVISAIIAGLVGFFYVSYIRYIDPDIMIQSKSTEIVLPAVRGRRCLHRRPADRRPHHDPAERTAACKLCCHPARHQHADVCHRADRGHPLPSVRYSGLVHELEGQDLHR